MTQTASPWGTELQRLIRPMCRLGRQYRLWRNEQSMFLSVSFVCSQHGLAFDIWFTVNNDSLVTRNMISKWLDNHLTLTYIKSTWSSHCMPAADSTMIVLGNKHSQKWQMWPQSEYKYTQNYPKRSWRIVSQYMFVISSPISVTAQQYN